MLLSCSGYFSIKNLRLSQEIECLAFSMRVAELGHKAFIKKIYFGQTHQPHTSSNTQFPRAEHQAPVAVDLGQRSEIRELGPRFFEGRGIPEP